MSIVVSVLLFLKLLSCSEVSSELRFLFQMWAFVLIFFLPNGLPFPVLVDQAVLFRGCQNQISAGKFGLMKLPQPLWYLCLKLLAPNHSMKTPSRSAVHCLPLLFSLCIMGSIPSVGVFRYAADLTAHQWPYFAFVSTKSKPSLKKSKKLWTCSRKDEQNNMVGNVLS